MGVFRRHHPNRERLLGAGYFSRLGPGIITGAADDDPSGIGTYVQVGAAQGNQLLWTAPYVFPLAFAVQEACARLALVTGTGLAATMRSRLPRPVLLVAVAALAIANTVNIAADLSSMVAAIRLIVPIPQVLGVVALATVIAVSEITISYRRYGRVLRWLCLALLAYAGVLIVSHVDWSSVLRSTFVPSLTWDKTTMLALIALLGTTISPYLFFWQAAEEAEEEQGAPDVAVTHVRAMRGDVFAGMASGVFAMFAIMAAGAATLHVAGITNLQTAEEAALALEPLAGRAAGLLFALGIIGTGLLAVPVLAGSTAYSVSETRGWREGQGSRPRIFAVVIVASMVIAIGMNALGVAPLHFLFLAAVLNGLIAPVLIVIVWWLARDRRTMGMWASGWLSQLLLGVSAVAMVAVPVLWLVVPD